MGASVSSSRSGFFAWLLLFTVLGSSLIWACGSAEERDTDAWGDASADARRTTSADGAVDRAAFDPTGGRTPTDANLKVAFIGDTAHGDNFQEVLALIQREAADLIVVAGDVTYGLFTSPNDWFEVIDNAVNAGWPASQATSTIPYLLAKGNHDSRWDELGGGMRERMAHWGIPMNDGDPRNINYAVEYKGLRFIMVGDDETSPPRADFVEQRLQNDRHVWNFCVWHRNMRASNVGPKDDEMSWTIYENCRKYGAIVAQGHSHTYSRSKTLTNDSTQTVDTACSDPFSICVSPGRHFFFDSSLGGKDTRELEFSVSQAAYWASAYTGSYGALFIEFHVDGDPTKARGYFKTIGDVVIDPPASSGQTSFTIKRSF